MTGPHTPPDMSPAQMHAAARGYLERAVRLLGTLAAGEPDVDLAAYYMDARAFADDARAAIQRAETLIRTGAR